jgi:hypothetical protein
MIGRKRRRDNPEEVMWEDESPEEEVHGDDDEEDIEEPSAADSASAATATRHRHTHPLTKFPDEISLWIYDEQCGSTSNEARDKLGLPHDTITRASFRHILSMEQSVLSMTVKEKRRLYLLMRHLTGGGEHLTTVGVAGSVSTQRAANSGGEGPWRENRETLATSSSEHLVPELGMTLGQLSVFHILLTRTHCVKEKHLDEIVAEHSQFAFEPIRISTSGE